MPSAMTKTTPTLVTSKRHQIMKNKSAALRMNNEVRGLKDSHDMEDWLRTESEIIGKAT